MSDSESSADKEVFVPPPLTFSTMWKVMKDAEDLPADQWTDVRNELFRASPWRGVVYIICGAVGQAVQVAVLTYVTMALLKGWTMHQFIEFFGSVFVGLLPQALVVVSAIHAAVYAAWYCRKYVGAPAD